MKKSSPRVTKSEPKGTKSEPKCTKSEPKGTQREPTGAEREPKESQMLDFWSQNHINMTKTGPKIDEKSRLRFWNVFEAFLGTKSEPKEAKREPTGAEREPKGNQK